MEAASQRRKEERTGGEVRSAEKKVSTLAFSWVANIASAMSGSDIELM